MSNYDEEYIEVLSTVEHARKRPELYVDSRDAAGIHQIIGYAINNVVLQAVKFGLKEATITLEDIECVTLSDNGQGIKMHGGLLDGKSDEGNVYHGLDIYTVPGHGSALSNIDNDNDIFPVGLQDAIALSENFKVETRYEGFLWSLDYKYGKLLHKPSLIRRLDNEETTGTTISFSPDYSIFNPVPIEYSRIFRRLRELSYLISDFQWTLEDRRSSYINPAVTFHAPQGLHSFVQFLNRDIKTLHDVVHFRKTLHIIEFDKNGTKSLTPFEAEIAFQFCLTPSSMMLEYANTEFIPLSGCITDCLLNALAVVVVESAKVRQNPMHITSGDIRSHLTAVVSTWGIYRYRYSSSLSKPCQMSNLIDEVNHSTITHNLADILSTYFSENPIVMDRILSLIAEVSTDRLERCFGD